MDQLRDNNDATSFILHILSNTSKNCPLPLKEPLIQVYEKWDTIMLQRGPNTPCPIHLPKEEIEQSWQQAEAWAAAFSESDDLQAQVSDG